MKLTSSALLIAPLLLFIGTTAAVPRPVAELDGTVNGVKAKIDQLVGARDTIGDIEATVDGVKAEVDDLIGARDTIGDIEATVDGAKAKVDELVGARDSVELLEAHASVTGTVNAGGVRYRRCASTSCEAVGQYNKGQVITTICRTLGDAVNGWNWWDKMDNGFYISDYYVDWTGGVPDVC